MAIFCSVFQGCVHQASLLLEGWIRDSVTGKDFQAPELWVAAILGNNIPVSSAYAWDKVNTTLQSSIRKYTTNTLII